MDPLLLEKRYWVRWKKIEVDKDFFRKYKTLICYNNFNHLTLKRKDGRRISFRFHSKDLSIWSKHNAGDFVCIEPWDGLPDFEKPNLGLSKKKGINSLKTGEEYLFSYEMEFIDYFISPKNGTIFLS